MKMQSIDSLGETRGARRTRRVSAGLRAGRTFAFALAVSFCLATPAVALTLSETTPLFFSGAGGFGFDAAAAASAGRSASRSATNTDLWLTLGPSITVRQRISAIHALPTSFSGVSPAIVDSTWTITNRGAEDLVAPLLVFTSLDPLDTYTRGASKPRQGLDAALLELLAYSHAGTDYLFGAAQLPNLAEGESAEITVRYIVASNLRTQGTSRLLAPMGVSLLGTYRTLPEPSTLLLLSAGLTVTCTWGFRRRRSSKRPGAPAGDVLTRS